jgi:L-serine dehydratase
MPVSAFDLFKVGIGPSSSHTVGPMRAACMFARGLDADGLLTGTASVHVELFGSLGATGHGHGTVKAVVAGLAGEMPDTVDPQHAEHLLSATRETGRLKLSGAHPISFDPDDDVVLHRRKRLAYHSNAMTFTAAAEDGTELASRTFYSVGGGFIVDEAARTLAEGPALVRDPTPVPFPFNTGGELIAHAERTGLPISGIVLRNECARRPEAEVRAGLLEIWQAMRQCVEAGLTTDGTLPGSLKVRRRASAMRRQLTERSGPADPLDPLDWVTAYALAVNEENAAGGRVVTAPTNGAAGIIPAVLHYYWNFLPAPDEDGVIRFLLVAAGIGSLFKENASISGAEVGCQARSGRPAPWRPAAWRRYWAVLRARSRTRPKSGSSTISGSPATRSAASCRSRASSGTPSPRLRRSPPPGWRYAATGSITCPWTRRSKRCARPAPT